MERNTVFMSKIDSQDKTTRTRFYLVLRPLSRTKQKYSQILLGKQLTFRFFLLLMLITGVNYAQQPVPPDSAKVKTGDGKGKLKAQVTYTAHDSVRFDIAGQKAFLYDSALVKYEQQEIRAYYIEIDFKNNSVLAEGEKDSTGKYISKAEFTDNGQQYTYDRIDYNFDTQKARITNASTIDGETHMIASEAFKEADNTTYIRRGIFTTCENDHPHYAIRARKLKIIPDDKIITGPAYLEIGDVPTPLGIPFGFFPNKRERSSGLIIPAPGESPAQGFFLRDGGWYWGLSDKIDLALKGDIYSKGSWATRVLSNYNVRYKYRGRFSASFARVYQGDPELPTSLESNEFLVTWNHTQDPKSNPSVRFSANVYAGSSKYNTFNSINANELLRNQFQSNIAWSKNWNFGSLSTNLRHSQNTQTRLVDVTLPQVSLAVNRFYPFRNNKRVGSRWYDKIGISAVTDFQNTLSVPDSTIKFDNLAPLQRKLNNGVKTSIPISSTIQFKNFPVTFTPAFNLNAYTYFNSIQKSFDTDSQAVVIDTLRGLKMAYDYFASMTMGTRLYGTWKGKIGKLRALRHVATPQASFTWRPDFSTDKYGWYKEVPINSIGGTSTYSIFENGIFGSPGLGKTGLLGFSLANTIEGKIKSDTSDVLKKFTVIDQFNVSFNYNVLAEHFNWSNINFSGRTRLRKLVDVNTTLSFDPYRIDSTGKRIERFEWRANKRIGRLENATVNIGTSLRKGGFTASAPKQSTKGTTQELEFINQNPDAFVDFNIPWTLTLMYTLNYSKPDTLVSVTQGLQFSGDVNLTDKWKIGFNSNYDIAKQKFSYTSVNIYRDLHCWEMSFYWVPFGPFQSYNLTINVKSAVLQDLKLNRRRNWYDF